MLLVLLMVTPACFAAKVIDSKDRAVELPASQLAWQHARAEDFSGLFESISIEGLAAASYWKIYYHFADDGTYTGAALVIGGAQPEFQTLSGKWKLDEAGLDLGNGQVGRAFAAPDHLKLESEGLTLILHHAPPQ
jgi:hypothetical protein